MNAKNLEILISNLGQSYDALVTKGLVTQPLQELYKGRDWLEVKPATGIELSFWAETMRFERLFISLISVVEGAHPYRGDLPPPLARAITKSLVQEQFGVPMESQGITKLPMNMVLGGFDTYKLDDRSHPNMKISFQYNSAMQVKTIVFSLIDRGHE